MLHLQRSKKKNVYTDVMFNAAHRDGTDDSNDTPGTCCSQDGFPSIFFKRPGTGVKVFIQL